MKNPKAVIFLSFFLFLFTSCFTGVESTPKITQKDVQKQKATPKPTSAPWESLAISKPADWKAGKKFYIADNRASRIASRIEPLSNASSLAGNIITLSKIDTVATLTDQPEVLLAFDAMINSEPTVLEFRTGLTPQQWKNAEIYTLPHIIDMDIVDMARQKMIGKDFYLLSARRIGNDGNDTLGTRYQKVRILDVSPATEATPLMVNFLDNEGHRSSILMTVGNYGTSRRNFDTIFSLTDPRADYSFITDENWDLIIHRKVKEGMTPEECKLALGAADKILKIPSTAGMVERWTYTDGIYLIFEDGYLTKFRQ